MARDIAPDTAPDTAPKAAQTPPIGTPCHVVTRDGRRLAAVVISDPITAPQPYSEGQARRTTDAYRGCVRISVHLPGQGWVDSLARVGEGVETEGGYLPGIAPL